MADSYETVVIGGGQAGLATSYFLTRRGHKHIVLELGRVAETWRTARWDGFSLDTACTGIYFVGLHWLSVTVHFQLSLAHVVSEEKDPDTGQHFKVGPGAILPADFACTITAT